MWAILGGIGERAVTLVIWSIGRHVVGLSDELALLAGVVLVLVAILQRMLVSRMERTVYAVRRAFFRLTVVDSGGYSQCNRGALFSQHYAEFNDFQAANAYWQLHELYRSGRL